MAQGADRLARRAGENAVSGEPETGTAVTHGVVGNAPPDEGVQAFPMLGRQVPEADRELASGHPEDVRRRQHQRKCSIRKRNGKRQQCAASHGSFAHDRAVGQRDVFRKPFAAVGLRGYFAGIADAACDGHPLGMPAVQGPVSLTASAMGGTIACRIGCLLVMPAMCRHHSAGSTTRNPSGERDATSQRREPTSER